MLYSRVVDFFSSSVSHLFQMRTWNWPNIWISVSIRNSFCRCKPVQFDSLFRSLYGCWSHAHWATCDRCLQCGRYICAGVCGVVCGKWCGLDREREREREGERSTQDSSTSKCVDKSHWLIGKFTLSVLAKRAKWFCHFELFCSACRYMHELRMRIWCGYGVTGWMGDCVFVLCSIRFALTRWYV